MTHSDIILMMDKKYAGDEAVACPNEGQPVKSQNGNNYSEHGKLSVHKSGNYLVCGRCEYKHAASI